jgi:predicted TIM-barrel fold metal-dependent hydrolase
MITVVDPHVHLIALADGEYGWLQPSNPPFWPDKSIIARSFSPADLTLSAPLALHAFVHVEAGFDNAHPHREVAYLEQHYLSSTPFNTIATCDLTLPTEQFQAQIDALSALRSCVGVRHILDEDARTLLDLPQVITNLHALAHAQLIFECQCDLTDARVVEQIIAFHRSTSHVWVINHAGIGAYNDANSLRIWTTQMKALARCPNIHVKASGWEMVDRQYTADAIKPIIKQLVAIFGEERVLLASNFPLTLFRQSYQDYWQMMHDVLVELGFDETHQRALLGQNARAIYFTTT